MFSMPKLNASSWNECLACSALTYPCRVYSINACRRVEICKNTKERANKSSNQKFLIRISIKYKCTKYIEETANEEFVREYVHKINGLECCMPASLQLCTYMAMLFCGACHKIRFQSIVFVLIADFWFTQIPGVHFASVLNKISTKIHE